MLHSPDQSDFFSERVFETRERKPMIDPDLFRLRMKTAMSEVIREGGFDRTDLALDMGRMIAMPGLSKGMLDNYTSPSKTDHDIPLIRFKAFVRATDANHLWDLAVKDDGLIVLQGDEARLAEIARLEQERRALGKKLQALRSKPVDIKRG